jgi:predicted N-acetyltransferase YhbS
VTVRLALDDDWPAILEVHAAAFGDEDVARLARELHESDVYVPVSPLWPWPTGAWSVT